MELEVDLKQILKNHHTRPLSLFFFFLMESSLILERK